jgi:hypothetical protein
MKGKRINEKGLKSIMNLSTQITVLQQRAQEALILEDEPSLKKANFDLKQAQKGFNRASQLLF